MSCVFNAITGLVVQATNCHCFTAELYPSLNNSLHACVNNVLKNTFAKAQNKTLQSSVFMDEMNIVLLTFR